MVPAYTVPMTGNGFLPDRINVEKLAVPPCTPSTNVPLSLVAAWFVKYFPGY